MKKFLTLALAALLCLAAVCASAGAVRMDGLALEFVPSRDADAIIKATANLNVLLHDALLEEGYDVPADKIAISVGADYNATGDAMAAGNVDVGWLPGGTYARYSDSVDVILTCTRAGLSNDSEDPVTWNGDANKTQLTDEQVNFYRSLIYAGPSDYGRKLAAKVNAGEALTWKEIDAAKWGVQIPTSSAGYIYPSLWLMDHYDGKKVTDLSHAVPMTGFGDAFAQAAAETVDIIVCYADGRRDYEEAWTLPTDSQDSTGKAGMGRADSIWNECSVIGVTPGIYNDTVAVTKANPDVYNPEFIAAMQNALINIINTPEGAEIFDVYNQTGYAIASDADYDCARAALAVTQ